MKDKNVISSATNIADGIIHVNEIELHKPFQHLFVPLYNAKDGSRLEVSKRTTTFEHPVGATTSRTRSEAMKHNTHRFAPRIIGSLSDEYYAS